MRVCGALFLAMSQHPVGLRLGCGISPSRARGSALIHAVRMTRSACAWTGASVPIVRMGRLALGPGHRSRPCAWVGLRLGRGISPSRAHGLAKRRHMAAERICAGCASHVWASQCAVWARTMLCMCLRTLSTGVCIMLLSPKMHAKQDSISKGSS